ncbi:unnamed protein product [Nezara viridula]|uniref:Uncharacterized protein n=1 Tax=Nezara viridula TaxID=85310 RepID=A0A9P0HCL6_NEZVI|nr:unnamed protein product [Nezara viridula]
MAVRWDVLFRTVPLWNPLCDGSSHVRCINDTVLMDQGHCLVGLILQIPVREFTNDPHATGFTNAVCECEFGARLSNMARHMLKRAYV